LGVAVSPTGFSTLELDGLLKETESFVKFVSTGLTTVTLFSSTSEEESDNEEKENLKNYILIKDEITPELVKNVFDTLSPYLDEDDHIEIKKVKNERKK